MIDPFSGDSSDKLQSECDTLLMKKTSSTLAGRLYASPSSSPDPDFMGDDPFSVYDQGTVPDFSPQSSENLFSGTEVSVLSVLAISFS